MIAIKVGTTNLVLPPGLKLKFEFLNSAFDFETIPADLVWSFDLPAQENAQALEFCHFIEIKNKRRAYDATATLHGKEIIGKLITQKVGNIRIACSFIVNGFPVDALERKMNAVITGSVSFAAPEVHQSMVDHANYCVTKTWPDVNYNFVPYKNTAFYGSENPTVGDMINNWNIGTQSFERNSIFNTDYNEFSLSPWLYLCFVVKQLFLDLGYTASGSFFRHPEIKKMLLYNNYALDRVNDIFRGSFTGASSHSLTVGQNVIIPINNDTTAPNSDPYDLFDTSTYEFTLDEYGEYAITCNVNATVTSGLSGDLEVQIFVDGVFFSGLLNDPTNLQPFTFTLPDLNGKLTLRLFAYGSVSFTINSATFFVLKGYSPLLNVYSKQIDYANHVPDIQVRDFIVALRKFPGLKINFNPSDRSVSLDLVKDIFTAKADDVTSIAAKNYEADTNTGNGYTIGFDFTGDTLLEDNFPDLSQMEKVGDYADSTDLPTAEASMLNKYALVLNTNKIYKVIFDTPNYEWQLLSDNYYDKIVGDGKTEIRSAISPMFMTKMNDVIIPHIEQTGSTPAFSTGINSFPLKVVIWHGMQAGFGGDYPLASSMNRDFNGDEIGDLTLRHDDDTNGLYVNFFQKWIEFLMSTETIVRAFLHSVNDLFGDLFNRKKTVQHVENVYKKVSVEISSETITEAEVEHCKIL